MDPYSNMDEYGELEGGSLKELADEWDRQVKEMAETERALQKEQDERDAANSE